MLERSRQRILASLADSDLVLDVGGGGMPFERADWVIDLLPYAGRGLYHYAAAATAERFGAETWVQRDMCDREPWPFADRQFDFVVCAHTLEDVRDPLWVCAEMSRVGRAGYIEVPSRLEEQSYGFQGPWVGRGHHRWLIDVDADDRLTFVFKHHVVHARDSDHFPAGFRDRLQPEQRVSAVFWSDALRCSERIFHDAQSLDAYLADFVAAHRDAAGPPPSPVRPSVVRRAGRAARAAARAWRGDQPARRR